jgi:nitrate/nitrite transport system substrate-binding protein
MKNLLASLAMTTAIASPAFAELLDPEKEDLKFGFIKLTDMAPLAIAYEKGYFEDEGLYVTLEAQANWKVLLDRVIDGQLDGAHMLAGQPLAATIGFGTEAHIITPLSMDLNGNGITVSNEVWEQMKPEVPKMEDGRPQHPIKADALKPVVDAYKEEGSPSRWAWSSRSRRTTTSCATGSPPAAITPATTPRTRATSPARSTPTCCSP